MFLQMAVQKERDLSFESRNPNQVLRRCPRSHRNRRVHNIGGFEVKVVRERDDDIVGLYFLTAKERPAN
jgi:hypothetical protein